MIFRANFYPNYIVTFPLCDKLQGSQLSNCTRPEKNLVKGFLSKKSKLLMIKALSWLYLFSTYKKLKSKKDKLFCEFRLNFITLTLSDAQQHSDDYIKIHMLSPFLKWLSRCNVKHYVWKAEAQDNGNIHFHISTNKFIYWRKIRDKWNHIQFKNGYLNQRLNHGKDLDPNSTDVHAVRSEKGYVSYMTKYMSKDFEERKNFKPESLKVFCNSELERQLASMSIADAGISAIKRPIEGKLWACSRDLLNIRVSFDTRNPSYGDVVIKTCKDLKAQFRKHDYCDTWRHGMINMNTKLHPELAEAYSKAYNEFHRINP